MQPFNHNFDEDYMADVVRTVQRSLGCFACNNPAAPLVCTRCRVAVCELCDVHVCCVLFEPLFISVRVLFLFVR